MVPSSSKFRAGYLFVFIISGTIQHLAFGQQAPSTIIEAPTTRLWLNSYGNIQLTDKLFWVAQTHIRFQESENLPAFGQLNQIYNRHAISYVFSKKFNASFGGVLRLNVNTNSSPDEEKLVPEWRIWHDYLFAVPFPRLMVYHRLRVEHRWTRSFEENSDFTFRNRWRYMFNAKIPLNSKSLTPGTYYISPEMELIMQNGKRVIDSPMEDLRLHTSFGYIVNSRLILASGLMYSTGQDLENGAIYNQRWTVRLHAYFLIDLRKNRNSLPSFEFPVNFNDH